MKKEEKAKMIAEQCKPCSDDFYSGIYQGVLIALNAEDINGDSFVKIDNAYIQDADTIGSYDATGRVSSLWITKQDFDQIKCINN